MRVLIDVPFRDAAASDLAWALTPDAAPPAGLALLDVSAGDWAVRLHVLGASHAVELASPRGERLTETVACSVAGGCVLERAPSSVDAAGVRYGFSSDVDAPGAAAVAALADDLGSALAADPHGLVARFPGAPGAMTGLRARVLPDGAEWDTWHLYPERGEVVRTHSTAVLVPAGTAR